jgi:hypothetical protein
MMEAEGVYLAQDQAANPDSVAAAYDKITDMTSARPFASAAEYVDHVLARF